MTTTQKVIKYCALAFAVFLIVSILSGIVSAVAALAGLFTGESPAGENRVYTLEQDIQTLSIDISAGALELRTGDAFALESNHRYLEVSTDKGILHIRETGRLVHSTDYSDVKILLTIPENFLFAKAEIAAGAGTVRIRQLICDSLDMELGAGEAIIDTLTARKEADIETGAGKLTVSGCDIRNLELDMGMGEMNMTGSLTGTCRLELGMGKTRLELIGQQDDYTISFEKGLGDARLDGKRLENGTYGSGGHQVEIRGGIGAIEIEFA